MPFLCPVQCYFVPASVPLKEKSLLMQPLDEASLVTKRPMEEASLYDPSLGGGGGLWLGEVLNYHLTLPKLVFQVRDTSVKGASSKERHVLRDIRDISFGEHIVMASFVLCLILPFLDVRIKLRHFINSLSAKFPLIDNIKANTFEVICIIN